MQCVFFLLVFSCLHRVSADSLALPSEILCLSCSVKLAPGLIEEAEVKWFGKGNNKEPAAGFKSMILQLTHLVCVHLDFVSLAMYDLSFFIFSDVSLAFVTSRINQNKHALG